MKLTVLAWHEGSVWVVQAIEQDIASQSRSSLLDALEDLGRMFDWRDHYTEANLAVVPRAPAEFDRAIAEGHYVGMLPLGRVRVAQVYIGASPVVSRTP